MLVDDRQMSRPIWLFVACKQGARRQNVHDNLLLLIALLSIFSETIAICSPFTPDLLLPSCRVKSHGGELAAN